MDLIPKWFWIQIVSQTLWKLLLFLRFFSFCLSFSQFLKPTDVMSALSKACSKRLSEQLKWNSPAYMTFSKKAVSLISLFTEPYVSSLKYPPHPSYFFCKRVPLFIWVGFILSEDSKMDSVFNLPHTAGSDHHVPWPMSTLYKTPAVFSGLLAAQSDVWC